MEAGRFEIEDLIDSDDAGAVVANIRLRGQARHTGIALDVPFSIVIWLRGGLICRTISFSDKAEALEAAGLSE